MQVKECSHGIGYANSSAFLSTCRPGVALVTVASGLYGPLHSPGVPCAARAGRGWPRGAEPVGPLLPRSAALLAWGVVLGSPCTAEN